MAGNPSNADPPGDFRPGPSHEPDLSLSELSAAFAEAIGRREESAAPEEPGNVSSPASPVGTEESTPAEAGPDDDRDACCPISPRSILEAMLFVGDPSGAPLTSQRLAGVMRGVEAAEIHSLVRELNRQYSAARCPYRVIGEGAGYRLALTSDFHRLRDKFYGRVRQARLSQAAVDVLSLVAYHEPLTAEQIGRLRGVASGPVLAQLVRRQLLRIERLTDGSRTVHYRTTRRFLDLFGLESLADLPTSQELEQK